MKVIQRTAWVGAFVLAATVAAGCGGDDDDGGDGGAGAADAGPDAAPLITGSTAEGVYPAAYAEAQARFDDAVLYMLTGQRIGNAGEVDVTTNQSWWSYAFVSPGQGMQVTAFWTEDAFTVGNPTAIDVESIRVITTDWINSDVALAKLAENGFVLPGPSDVYTTISMQLGMYVGISEDFLAIPDPIWKVTKITAPPAETPVGEEWWITYTTIQGMTGHVICTPTGDCSLVP